MVRLIVISDYSMKAISRMAPLQSDSMQWLSLSYLSALLWSEEEEGPLRTTNEIHYKIR